MHQQGEKQIQCKYWTKYHKMAEKKLKM